jgi:prolyl-tRNA editing enzyme YbaK/EbsC (Cys-tRNA(Pro) deacylase)
MDSVNLEQYIAANGIPAEIVVLQDETPTVAAAAAAVGVRPEQIVKSVLFLADGRPLLVVTNGLTRIQRKRLADAVQLSRRRIKIADGEQVARLTGYEVGAVPPFGHPQPLPTLLDSGVLAEAELYGGGGATNALMRLTPQALLAATKAQIVDIADREGQNNE